MSDPKDFKLNPLESEVVKRAAEYTAGKPPRIRNSDIAEEPITDEERAALRAFLQRAETRLSTYQRVAGVFLNGAGLLILLPTTARDSIQAVAGFALSEGLANPRATLLVPLILTIAVPMYAFFLLVKDVVEFYFAPHFLADDTMQLTRFSLAGLTFPYDEGVEQKARILAYSLTDPAYVNFVLGGSEKSRKAVRDTYQAGTNGVAFPLRFALNMRIEEAAKQRTTDVTDQQFQMLSAAMAGSLDMTLAGEAARVEASLERHVLKLRRLVLRYTKSLLLFLWTGLLVMCVAVLARDDSGATRTIPALTLYLTWDLTSIWVIRLPRIWIDRLAFEDGKGGKRRTKNQIQDNDISSFEKTVTIVLLFGAAAISISLIFSVLGGVW